MFGADHDPQSPQQLIEQMAAEQGIDPAQLMQQVMQEAKVCESHAQQQKSAKRLEGNAKFKAGDYAGAAAAYKAALEDPTENRLPLLSNLGLCHLKMHAPAAAVRVLSEALTLTPDLHASPKLATKVAARAYQAHEAMDSCSNAISHRRVLFELQYFARRKSLPGLPALPVLPDEKNVSKAIITMVNAPRTQQGLGADPTGHDRAEWGRNRLARQQPSLCWHRAGNRRQR